MTAGDHLAQGVDPGLTRRCLGVAGNHMSSCGLKRSREQTSGSPGVPLAVFLLMVGPTAPVAPLASDLTASNEAFTAGFPLRTVSRLPGHPTGAPRRRSPNASTKGRRRRASRSKLGKLSRGEGIVRQSPRGPTPPRSGRASHRIIAAHHENERGRTHHGLSRSPSPCQRVGIVVVAPIRILRKWDSAPLR
jgi:hypothetical protein